MDRLIEEAAERIFADHVHKELLDRADAAMGGEFPTVLWHVIQEAGLHLVGSPASGTSAADIFALVKVAGRHAAPLPLAEILIANAVTDSEGLTTIAVDGVAPWARAADRVLAIDGTLCREFEVVPGSNLAGEPRDRVVVADGQRIDVPPDLLQRLALARAAAMAGALEHVLALSIDYATTRQQFGRPIGKFQAIQHSLAVLAGEVAAADCACAAAAAAIGRPGFGDQAAAAKARVGEAAGFAAQIAHQVHGAMGFTHEHSLHHFTRRLWSWRDEYGSESHWQERLGQRIASDGADRVWEFVTSA